MGSLQILKSGLYPFSVSQSNFGEKEGFICPGRRRIIKFQNRSLINRRKFKLSCKVQDTDKNDGNGEEPPESLFMKELRRRGMTPTSLLEESRVTSNDEDVRYKEEDGGFSNRNAVSTDLDKSLSNQREKSMALNSEGLEGLIPRAKLLLTIGGTFFLSFWPLMIVTTASFTAVYLYFGSSFIHDATTRHVSVPQYVDPYALLEDERISRTAPRLE